MLTLIFCRSVDKVKLKQPQKSEEKEIDDEESEDDEEEDKKKEDKEIPQDLKEEHKRDKPKDKHRHKKVEYENSGKNCAISIIHFYLYSWSVVVATYLLLFKL